MNKEKIISDIENKYQQLGENSERYLNKSETNSMHLLEPKQMIDIEGFLRFLKIDFNSISNPQARKNIFEMRRTFKKDQKHFNAIAIVAENF